MTNWAIKRATRNVTAPVLMTFSKEKKLPIPLAPKIIIPDDDSCFSVKSFIYFMEQTKESEYGAFVCSYVER